MGVFMGEAPGEKFKKNVRKPDETLVKALLWKNTLKKLLTVTGNCDRKLCQKTEAENRSGDEPQKNRTSSGVALEKHMQKDLTVTGNCEKAVSEN